MIQPYYKSITASEWKDDYPEIGPALKEIADTQCGLVLSKNEFIQAVPVKYGFHTPYFDTGYKWKGIAIIMNLLDDKKVEEAQIVNCRNLVYIVITHTKLRDLSTSLNNIMQVGIGLSILDTPSIGAAALVDKVGNKKDSERPRISYCSENLGRAIIKELQQSLGKETNKYELICKHNSSSGIYESLSKLSCLIWQELIRNGRLINTEGVLRRVSQYIHIVLKTDPRKLGSIDDELVNIMVTYLSLTKNMSYVLYQKAMLTKVLSYIEKIVTNKISKEEVIADLRNESKEIMKLTELETWYTRTKVRGSDVTDDMREARAYLDEHINKLKVMGYQQEIFDMYTVLDFGGVSDSFIEIKVYGRDSDIKNVPLKLKNIGNVNYYIDARVENGIKIKVLDDSNGYFNIILAELRTMGHMSSNDIRLRNLNNEFKLLYSLECCKFGWLIPSKELADKLLKTFCTLFRYDGDSVKFFLKPSTFSSLIPNLTDNNKFFGEMSINGLKLKHFEDYYDLISLVLDYSGDGTL